MRPTIRSSASRRTVKACHEPVATSASRWSTKAAIPSGGGITVTADSHRRPSAAASASPGTSSRPAGGRAVSRFRSRRESRTTTTARVRKPAPRLTAAILCTGLALSACALSPAAVPTSAPPPIAAGTRPAATRPASPLAAAMKVGLGSGASLGGKRVLPADNPWNTAVDRLACRPELGSADRLDRTRHHAPPRLRRPLARGPFGIPYVVVKGSQKKVKVTFTALPEGERQGQVPDPEERPDREGLEDQGDRHVS